MLLLTAAGFGTWSGCGGSTANETRCARGDFRICMGDGRCQGAQSCLADGSGFGPCECATVSFGGVSGSAAGGASATGGASGTAFGGASGTAFGGASGTAFGGVSGAIGIGGAIGFGGSSDGGGGACASIRVQSEPIPLDLFILLDQSGSMVLVEDRWTPIVSAIKTFVAAPETVGIGVGLNYFGLHPPGQPPVDPTSPGSCNANDYARPEVPIDVLPNVRMAIENSLNSHVPGGGTPTHPALQGSMQYVTLRAVQHPNRKAVIVLVTDGEPEGCDGNDVNTISQVAAAGAAANPQINTYVIGVGPNLQALNQVAQAGGSDRAYFVAPGNSQQALEALKQIPLFARGCEFVLPVGPGSQTIDFARLNLFFTPTGGAEIMIYRVESLADCRADTGGWYYSRDSQGTPIRVELCPVSCGALNSGGTLDFALGCWSVPPP